MVVCLYVTRDWLGTCSKVELAKVTSDRVQLTHHHNEGNCSSMWNINISGGFIAVHSVVYIQVLYYIRSNPTFYRHTRLIIPLLIFWLFWTSVSLGLSLVGLNWNYVSKFLAPHIVLASAHMQTDVLKISSVCLKIGLGGGWWFLYFFEYLCTFAPSASDVHLLQKPSETYISRINLLEKYWQWISNKRVTE